MKFLATATLLFASLADTASAGSVQRKLDHWDGEHVFLDPTPLLTRKNMWKLKRPCSANSDCMYLIPRASSKGPGRRLDAVETNQEHRKLAVTVKEAPEDGATIVGEMEEYFSFEGIVGSASLVFTQGSQVEQLDDLVGLMTDEDGLTEVEIYPGLGAWTWSLVVDGEEVESVGGQVTFAPASSGDRNRPGSDIQTNSGTAPAGGDVNEGSWEGAGAVQEAVGRIYFNSYGVDYACTGTVVKDNKSGRTLVFTAAHCVWDDIDENWGANAVFIPNRDAHTYNLTNDEIHRMCTEDICGCWSLSGGVVHDLWPNTPWPDRLDYDYGFWVVDDVGSHDGTDNCGSDALDIAVDALQFSVGGELLGDYIYNFGYSLEYNPDFRYCTEEVGSRDPTPGTSTGWMDECGLTGGASGGPWISDFDEATGSGKVVSVNSWSYSTRDGMGGPFIDASAARCLVNEARAVAIVDLEAMVDAGGGAGLFADCHDRPCIEDEESVRKLRGNRKLCETTDAKP